MRNGSLLVKEVIGSASESLQLSGCIMLPFPIREVYKLKYSMPSVKTAIGKKGIAYFGAVNLKLYCINDHDQTMRLVEESIHFQGFAHFPEAAEEEPPTVNVVAVVQDVFIKEICVESVKIFTLLLVKITFTKEKEIDSIDMILNQGRESRPDGSEFPSRASNEYHVVVESNESDPELIIQNLKIE